MSTIDLRAFVASEFGSTKDLHEAFVDAGLDPPKERSVYQWTFRKSLPGVWLAAALLILEKQRGAPVSLKPYFEIGTSDPADSIFD